MNDVEEGDIIVCNTHGLVSLKLGETCKVMDVDRSGKKLKVLVNTKYYGPLWIGANRFRLHTGFNKKEKVNKGMFLVYELVERIVEENTPIAYDILHTPSVLTFSTEKEAKDAMRNFLKENPEKILGLFPLSNVAKVDAPPIKFTNVWHK